MHFCCEIVAKFLVIVIAVIREGNIFQNRYDSEMDETTMNVFYKDSNQFF